MHCTKTAHAKKFFYFWHAMEININVKFLCKQRTLKILNVTAWKSCNTQKALFVYVMAHGLWFTGTLDNFSLSIYCSEHDECGFIVLVII